MFQIQAAACHALGSPFYGVLLQRMAKDIASDGPTAAILAGHESDAGPEAIALRLLAGVHHTVLTHHPDARMLAQHYPSVGGDGDPVAAWPAMVDLMRSQPLELASWLHQAPQTNEVGRAAPLFGALLGIAGLEPLPVRLYEIGAAAGLNLRADRFRYRSRDGHGYGPMSPVDLDDAFVTMPVESPGLIHVVERIGADTHPLDPLDPAGVNRLQAYIWPDQRQRRERLRRAVLVAGQYPATVHQMSAVDLVNQIELADGHLTVLWHSVVLQYLGGAEKARIADRLNTLGAQATTKAPFAHISFELRRLTPQGSRRYLVTAETWPGGHAQILGEAPAHGMPVTWGRPAPDSARPAPDGPQWPI